MGWFFGDARRHEDYVIATDRIRARRPSQKLESDQVVERMPRRGEELPCRGWVPYDARVKIYRDLELKGDSAAVAEARKRLSALSPTATWQRDDQIVNRAPMVDATAFKYQGSQAPGAFVWLTWEADAGEVSNIVPDKAGSLTYDQYNEIAKRFADEVLRPALSSIASLRIDLGPVEEQIDDLLSKNTADALRAFSRSANKSTGAAHPNDAERWNAFLIRAHMEKSKLEPDTLHRWLEEDEGWKEEQANELAIQYEQGRELLRQYDEEKGI